MHLPGDILSQLMHPPRWHFVPLSQYESPYLGQSLRVSQAYLGYILGNFWAYLRHICKKTIVQLAFLGRQIVPSDKMSHFLPRDKLSHQTNCPISSPETKCPTDALIKNHCSTGIFRETNCPIRQIVPLSPRRQNVPNYAMMHRKVAGKLLGHFVSCPTLSIWRPIPWAKVSYLANMYWTYSGYILCISE